MPNIHNNTIIEKSTAEKTVRQMHLIYVFSALLTNTLDTKKYNEVKKNKPLTICPHHYFSITSEKLCCKFKQHFIYNATQINDPQNLMFRKYIFTLFAVFVKLTLSSCKHTHDKH